VTRVSLFCAGLLLLAACGASHKKVEAPVLPPANPQALSKMVQGVQSAKDANGKEHAIALLRDAITADPGLWEAHYNLGILLADKGDLKPAERELSDAAKLAPNAEDVAVALSEVRRRQGDADGGIDALEGFVKQNPDAKVASIALVTALREGGRVKEAIEQAQRVLVYHSSDPYALSELALANMELDEVDTAELLIEEALKSDDKSAVAERAATGEGELVEDASSAGAPASRSRRASPAADVLSASGASARVSTNRCSRLAATSYSHRSSRC